VHDPGLGWGQPQPERCQHGGDVFAEGLHVGLVAVHEDDEVVRLCRAPDYAAHAPGSLWCVEIASGERGIIRADLAGLEVAEEG
jgi:hypothetical protein